MRQPVEIEQFTGPILGSKKGLVCGKIHNSQKHLKLLEFQ